MYNSQKRSPLSFIPGYNQNPVLRLIFFLSVAYVMLGLTWGVMMLLYQDGYNFNRYILTAVAMPVAAGFKTHFWTLFTYGILNFPAGFAGYWELVSNMLWLYCFGSVIQMLVGGRQVAPLFYYSLLVGGLCYLLVTLIPGSLGVAPPLIMGPRAGLMGLCAASVTLTPKYRFYLTETFSIPLVLVAGVFTLLLIVSSGFYLSVLAMVAGGGLSGFAFIRLLKAGYPPAGWVFGITDWMQQLVTPSARQASRKKNPVKTKQASSHTDTQKRIDEVLDKINQKGYHSLTAEEREVLFKAGKNG